MTRRNRKQGVADLLVDKVSKLPWWVGVVAAAAFYLVLHRMAAPTGPATLTPGQIGGQVTLLIWKSFATGLQYILPFLLLLAAGISAAMQFQRRKIVKSVTQSDPLVQMGNLSWKEFEILVAEAFRIQGFRVTETGGGGADGGVDIRLKKGNELFLVQCKHWKAFNVGVSVVRELYGVMAAEGATGGYVLASGKFSDDARTFAQGKNLTLIEGPALIGLLERAKSNIDAATPKPERTTIEFPLCPQCGSDMVRRRAAKGMHAGKEFWGCGQFPRCGGIRRIATDREAVNGRTGPEAVH